MFDQESGNRIYRGSYLKDQIFGPIGGYNFPPSPIHLKGIMDELPGFSLAGFEAAKLGFPVLGQELLQPLVFTLKKIIIIKI